MYKQNRKVKRKLSYHLRGNTGFGELQDADAEG